MNTVNPRSRLHALIPIGAGTSEVESLLGYFCRLANSHSVSATTLAKTVANILDRELREGFNWHERNLSGAGESARAWSSALAALTGVGRLDRLTLSPWRAVVAERGFAARTARWCPACFAEDLEAAHDPYFRLAWEVGAVSACAKHAFPLVDTCPHCSRRGIRHAATYVIPGWCTSCGHFLGRDALPPDESGLTEERLTEEELWRAREIGALLAAQAELDALPDRAMLHETLHALVVHLDDGSAASFARRLELGKATVHNWLQDGGLPSLAAVLRIATAAGLSLVEVLTGQIDGKLGAITPQLKLALPSVPPQRRAAPRTHDWEAIRSQLREFLVRPTPISVAEVGRRLGIDARHLYLQANREARVLGERWKQHVARCGVEAEGRARPAIEAACRETLAAGRAISLREIEARVPSEILGSVERLFDMLTDIKAELLADASG